MHCFREYLQTTGKSVCLPHLIRLGCRAAGGAAAGAAGRRSCRTSCRSGCRNRETVHWRSTVLHWRGPTKNWAECEGRDKRERKTCLEINSSRSTVVSVCYYVTKWLLASFRLYYCRLTATAGWRVGSGKDTGRGRQPSWAGGRGSLELRCSH